MSKEEAIKILEEDAAMWERIAWKCSGRHGYWHEEAMEKVDAYRMGVEALKERIDEYEEES